MVLAYAGATLWVCSFLTIGYLVGDHWRGLVAGFHRHMLIASLVGVALAAGYTYLKTRR